MAEAMILVTPAEVRNMTKLILAVSLMTGMTAVALLPRTAAANVNVNVQLPTIDVSVNGPQGPAPGPGYVWEPARWSLENGTWVQRPGYWRRNDPAAVAVALPTGPTVYEPVEQQPVDVDVAPPAPVVETRTAAPGGGAVWIPGYWRWHQGRHHWMSGRWSAPRHGHHWEPARWSRHGHRWAYEPGRWRRDDNDDRRRWDRDRDRDRNRDQRQGHHQHHRGHHGR